jgi:hypothetical protein
MCSSCIAEYIATFICHNRSHIGGAMTLRSLRLKTTWFWPFFVANVHIQMFQIVPGIYDALSKTFCAVVSLLLIRFYSVYVVKVTPFQLQNFQVFVENGTFGVELFGWLRANVVQGVTGQDSFFRRIHPNFCTE